MMRKVILFFVVFITSLLVFAGSDDPIPNLYQPRAMVLTAGQPTTDGFQQIAAMGVKTVINGLPEKECLPGEGSVVKGYQMIYHQLPFDPEGLNMETIQRFAELLCTEEKPLLIHCSTGNHVGGLWFAYRLLLDHASLPVALREGRRIGMKPAMEKVVYEWIINQRRGAES